jgi:amidohydrolase
MEELKKKAIEYIDKNRDRIIDAARKIYEKPELGYKENFATNLVCSEFERLGLKPERNIAKTGCRARVHPDHEGPAIAVMGELDAVISWEHPDCDKETGAVHACGHNNQVAAMLGTAIGLIESGVMDSLDGRVDFFGVPAEEYVEIEYRSQLREAGEISFFGGKQELIARGALDDVDMVMMIHSMDLSKDGKKFLLGPEGNGFVGKRIRFTGKEAHAGAAPHEGVNALNAAILAMNNIHAQRETFPDDQRIRVHPIITRGGDIVNIVPSDVRMESYVRGRTTEGILDANRKVTRAIKAGAEAVGAGVQIDDIPGYLPLLKCTDLDDLFRANLLEFVDQKDIQEGASFAGSFDIGDISHIMPVLHPLAAGVTGDIHTRHFKLEDPELAFILPAKVMAMTVIDLLSRGAETARRVKSSYTPKMSKQDYLNFMAGVSKTMVVELTGN